MALIPKLQLIAQDTDLYGSVTLQDNTGVYNATTNPGGYGAPNPVKASVTKIYLADYYLGDNKSQGFDPLPVLNILNGPYKWEHDFREGVSRLEYLVGFNLGGGFTGLDGNLDFELANASSVLANCSHIEIGGVVYAIDQSKALTNLGGYLATPIQGDHFNVDGFKFIQGSLYTLWNAQGTRVLLTQIGAVGCTSLQCGAAELDLLMVKHRFYLATGIEFGKGNYSKAHNLAVALSPDMGTSKCITC
jgi:hypothetical protein